MNEAIITYRNIFRDEMDIDDYEKWQAFYWPIQQSWGAVNYEIWEEAAGKICCRYFVDDIDKWNRRSAGPDAEALVSSLNRIVNLDKISLKISFPRDMPA
ncbi:hypothetical protein KAR48_07565 [bacterium]|nr:hypothetical protein [bacterium]